MILLILTQKWTGLTHIHLKVWIYNILYSHSYSQPDSGLTQTVEDQLEVQVERPGMTIHCCSG